MQVTSRILVNTASNWLATGVRALIGLALVPFLLVHLGKDGYGLTVLAGVIVTFAALMDFGMRTALSRQLAEQVAKDDKQRLNEFCASALAVYLPLALLSSAFCFLAAPWLVRVFNVPEQLYEEGVFLVRWFGGISCWLAFLTPVYGAVVDANARFELSNLRNTLVGILNGLGIFAVIGLTDWGIYGWAIVMLGGNVLGYGLTWQLAHRVWPSLRVRLHEARRSAVRELFSLGGVFFSMNVSAQVSLQANPLILSAFMKSGTLAVTIYNPAAALTAMMRPLIDALANQLYPLATTLHVTQRKEQMQSLLIRGTKYTVLMALPSTIVLGVFAEPIMRLWLGKQLGDDYIITAWVLSGWALIDLLTYAAGTQWAVTMGMKRLKFYFWIMVPPTIVSVGVAILLVKYTALGILGVVVPIVVLKALQRPACTVYVARLCSLTTWQYVKGSYLTPLMVMVILGAAAVGCRAIVPIRSIPVLLACAVGVGLVWIPLCWYLGFNHSDRESFRALLCRTWDAILRRTRPGESPDVSKEP